MLAHYDNIPSPSPLLISPTITNQPLYSSTPTQRPQNQPQTHCQLTGTSNTKMTTTVPSTFFPTLTSTFAVLPTTSFALTITPAVSTTSATITCVNLDKDHDDHNDPGDNDDCFQIVVISGVTSSIPLPKTRDADDTCDGPGDDDCTGANASGTAVTATTSGGGRTTATGGSASRPPNNNGAAGRRVVRGMMVGVVVGVIVGVAF
jgi:hypothetical protein